jgi:hypothetical protein
LSPFLHPGCGGHHQFDPEAYVLARLAAAGVTRAEALGLDTYSNSDRFYSYRRATHRAEPDYGRQLSLIALPDSASTGSEFANGLAKKRSNLDHQADLQHPQQKAGWTLHSESDLKSRSERFADFETDVGIGLRSVGGGQQHDRYGHEGST